MILAHTAPHQLERLARSLQHEHAQVFVHLDAKSDMTAFRHLESNGLVRYIRNRVPVSWGTYSLVQATINGFREMLDVTESFDFFNLLSAQDYPIKPIGYIHDYLARHRGSAFLHCLSINNEWLEGGIRLRKWDFGTLPFRGKYRLQAVWNFFAPARRIPMGLEPYGRSQWFTMPPDCIAYVLEYLEQNPKVERYFRFTWAADEVVFQTILYNSEYRSRIVNDNLRYIDWSEGKTNPKTFTLNDLEALAQTPALFARKFAADPHNPLLDRMDQTLCNPAKYAPETTPGRVKKLIYHGSEGC